MQPKMVQANSRVNQLKKISQHADRERKITVKSTTRWMRKEKWLNRLMLLYPFLVMLLYFSL